ncbi:MULTISPECIES: YbjN domain-containing protein [unclassified Microcoleus]|uniref:YbjN domain-containing protein n=1 Tax=unclassified Microcoleus TaxID=2642155 RepID=UPI002FD544CB
MNTQKEIYQLDNSLTLLSPSSSPVTVRAIALTFTQQHNTLIEVILTFEVTPIIYQRTDSEGLFNLLPELRACPDFPEFHPSTNIEIVARLKPDLLPNLTPYLDNIPDYFKNLNSSQPDNPLLSTSSWLALQVNQETTGYRTFWDYLPSDAITIDRIEPEKINEALTNFFSDSTAANLQFISEEALDRAIDEVAEKLQNLLEPSLFEFNETSISSVLEEIAKTFEQLAPSRQFELNQTDNTSPNILQSIADFFTAENKSFIRVQGEQILQMAVGGQNGKLTCYAQVIEEQSLFIFYSICPIKAPESQRQALAEFLTKINYDLIIGNFQLDLTSGQIRYKTSIDVSDSTLSTTQIKNLVYTNITMMDSHLPEILSVINNSPPPLDAIPINQTPTAPNFYSKNGKFPESKQIAVNPEKEQELDDSQTVPKFPKENTPPSLLDERSSDIESSKQIETTQEKEQELDYFPTHYQVDRETTHPLPSEESEDVQDSEQVETIQEKDQQLDFAQTLSQPDIETTFLSLDANNSEDIEGEQTVENYPDKDEQLQDAQTLSQPDRKNSLLSSPLERSSDVEDSQLSEENYQTQNQQLQDAPTFSGTDRENSLPPSPLERSSDVEYSPNTENFQDENLQFQDILTPSKIEQKNSHLFSISELYEVARKPSQPLQDNSLTTTLTEQVDPTQPPENFSLNPDILSDLTEEETASFESAIQLIKTGKLNAGKTILAAIKNNMTDELGEEGEQIFYTANNLFLVTNLPPASINKLNGYDKILPPNVQNIIPVLINPKLECNSIKIDYEFSADGLVSQIYAQVGAKTVAKELKPYFGTLKQIYRYWDISSQLKPLLEHIKNISTDRLKRSSQTTRDSLRSSERLPACIQTRLLQLVAEKLESQLEVDILIEVGELQELLAKTKRILNMEFLCDPAQAATDRKTIGSEG